MLVLPDIASKVPTVASTAALVGGSAALLAVLVGGLLALRVVRTLPPDSTFSVRLGPSGVRVGMARGTGVDDDKRRPPVPKTWQEFVEINHADLLEYAAKTSMNVGLPPDRIGDVYQEAVTGLAKSRSSARTAMHGPHVFMRGIIKKKALDVKFGRVMNDRFNAEAAALPDEGAGGFGNWVSAEEEAIRNEQVENLWKAVRDLPDRQRFVVTQVELLGDSIDEVATELEITPHAVSQALYKAKVALRDRFTNDR